MAMVFQDLHLDCYSKKMTIVAAAAAAVLPVSLLLLLSPSIRAERIRQVGAARTSRKWDRCKLGFDFILIKSQVSPLYLL